MHRSLLFSVALAAVLVNGRPEQARAQTAGTPSVRATNLARMTAERLNGGLQVYRAASCMHQQGGGSCLLRSSAEGFVFRFYGGGPGWQPLNQPPTVETEIQVAADGRTITKVIYNGPPRQTSHGGPGGPTQAGHTDPTNGSR